jgi:signal transduction histidine kinase
MSEPRWYHSLYWRIALGLFAFLALMLAAQGALFLWMTDRIAGSMPARDPRRLAVLVASDVGAALSSDPALDLKQYVRDQYSHVFQTFVVIMQDGRVASNDDAVPDEFVKAVIAESGRRAFPPRGRRFEGGAPPDGLLVPPSEGFPGPRPRRGGEFAPIIVNGVPAGRVAVVPGGPPFSRVVRELGPTMGLVGGGVLGVGMALIAYVIFGPARKRLRHVQDAAERLGGGDLAVRVPAGGGDEVAAVARSFNRMAEELTIRAEALAASDKARRQLLADVSHELMTPLAAVRGYTETLAMPELTLDAPTRSRYLGIVGDETQKLESLIGDLLDLARLEGGGGTLTMEDVPVKELFSRVIDRHGPAIRDRHISIDVSVQPPELTVRADGQRLEQALQNLAANALRHTPDGGRVSLAAERTADSTRMTVRDTGSGILAEHLPHIFERFYKADAARSATKLSGSGLGLSIVQAIVERHGGSVTAANAPDGGAMFEIRIPEIRIPPTDPPSSD